MQAARALSKDTQVHAPAAANTQQRALGCGLKEMPDMCPGIVARRAGSAAPAPPGRDQAAWRADATSNSCSPLPASATASTPPGPNAIAVMGSPACATWDLS